MSWNDIFTWPIYISSVSVFIVVVFYLPIVAVVVFKIRSTMNSSQAKKNITTLMVIFVALAIPFGDVYVASLQKNNLCREQSGMFIYRVVEGVEGFASNSSSTAGGSLYSGYKFSEYINTPSDQLMDKVPVSIKRYSLGYQGRRLESPIDNLTSDYFIYDEDRVLSRQIASIRRIIKIKSTDEILGEIVDFYYYLGWVDNVLIGWMGRYTPMRCKSKSHQIWDLYTKVLVPVKK